MKFNSKLNILLISNLINVINIFIVGSSKNN